MSNSSAPNTASQNGAPTPAHHQMHHLHHHHQQTINSILNQVNYSSTNLSVNTQSAGSYPQPTSSGVAPSPAGQAASTSAGPSNPATSERYSSSETWTSVVHSLMCHLQSSDNEQFAKRAIESLAKKLKDKPDEMDALMTAVQKKGTVQTKCITIPRTLDGRLQVAGRKGFPHVIYARLWRWPDLHKNELKHLPICLFPFDLKLDNVCVNPYHYQRVISPGFDLAGLTLSNRSYNNSFMSHASSSANNSQISPQIEQSNELNSSIKMEPVSTPSNSHVQVNSNQSIQNTSLMQAHQTSSSSNACTPVPSSSVSIQQSLNNTASNSQAYLSQFGNLFIPNSLGQLPNQPNSNNNHQYFSALNGPANNNQSLLSGNNPHNPIINTNQLLFNSSSNETSLNRNQNNSELQLNILNSGSNSSLPSVNQTPRRLTQDWQGSYPSPYSNASLISSQPVEVWLHEEFPEIDLNTPVPDYWCTINYYEGDLQIADIFKVRSMYQSVVIDGFFDSSREDRFCLGALTNVQRTNASEKARLHIGKGVQLENLSDGSVYVRCLSEYSVFFESYYLDRESGREPFDAVHKIYPGSYVKVFSLKECLRCLKLAASVEQQNNQQSPNSMLNNTNSNAINVDDLRRLCRLRFSFVKGWGPDYPRKTILETPCWCEVQLNRPLQFLDQLINSLSLNNPNSNAAIYPD